LRFAWEVINVVSGYQDQQSEGKWFWCAKGGGYAKYLSENGHEICGGLWVRGGPA
jgi:hypothetical protein